MLGPFCVSDHFKPASNYRNDPATLRCVSRHFSSKQARCNWFVSGLFERKMPFHSSNLTQNSLAGSFRPFVAGLISTDDMEWFGYITRIILRVDENNLKRPNWLNAEQVTP